MINGRGGGRGGNAEDTCDCSHLRRLPCACKALTVVSMTPSGSDTKGRLRVSLEIAADPTSTALLLAGPSAMDMWPGLRRVGTVEGLVRAEAPISTETADVLVRAEPPRRLPTSFVTHFAFTATEADQAAVPDSDGTLTLQYSEKGGEVSTHAVLELTPRGAGSLGQIHQLAEGFLDNLRTAAELRSTAA